VYCRLLNCTGTATDSFSLNVFAESFKVLFRWKFLLEVFTASSLQVSCFSLEVDHISLEVSLEVGASLSLEVTSPYHHELYVSTYT
jgi:hypothetical protein